MTTPIDRLVTRREFGRRSAATALTATGFIAGLSAPRPAHTAPPLPKPTTDLLDRSPFVYISPLRSDGTESTCHAELWYGWLDGAVIVTVAADRWKAQAIARGLAKARIWVGDHGRWKTWYGGTNEAFRQAPRFEARGERLQDDALLERLLALYEKKYPDEIAQWRGSMREGNADGSRVLLRYAPA